MSAILLPAHGARGPRPSSVGTLNWGSRQAEGLVAFYPLQGRAYDATGRYHGAPTSGGTWGGVAPGGSARVQSGSTHGINLSALINGPGLSGEGSLCVWVRCDSAASGGQELWHYRLDGNNEIEVTDFHGSGGLSTRFIHRQLGAGATSVTLPSLSAGEVAHYVFTWSDALNTCAGYKNGVLVQSSGTDVRAFATPAGITLGMTTGLNTGWIGAMWDAKVYKRALTAQDAWHHYDPATRWDLYWITGRRAFFQAAAAASAKPWLYRSHTHTLGAGFSRGAA